jgi:hypothetical protein
MKRNRLFFIQIQTLPLSMHHKEKESIDIACKHPMEIRGSTPDKKSH